MFVHHVDNWLMELCIVLFIDPCVVTPDDFVS